MPLPYSIDCLFDIEWIWLPIFQVADGTESSSSSGSIASSSCLDLMLCGVPSRGSIITFVCSFLVCCRFSFLPNLFSEGKRWRQKSSLAQTLFRRWKNWLSFLLLFFGAQCNTLGRCSISKASQKHEHFTTASCVPLDQLDSFEGINHLVLC